MILRACGLRGLILLAGVSVLATVATAGEDARARADTSTDRAVTIIGLGHMGAVLAKTFVDRGLKVTVWNRTPAKAAPLVAAGAVPARSPRDAIAASPLTITSLIDKTVARSILDSPGVVDVLKGRTIVDLSSGSAVEARSNAARVTVAGGGYLDGGVMEYPRSIGKNDAVIDYSGSVAIYRRHERTLAILAGDQRYLGEDSGAAATTYLALWNYYFVALAAYRGCGTRPDGGGRRRRIPLTDGHDGAEIQRCRGRCQPPHQQPRLLGRSGPGR
jgi:NAD binding domain of 6-phosphogluconate dehydrogenase